MPAQHPASLSPQDVLKMLKDHPRLWLAPAIGLALLAATYSLLRERTWQASQALIIREEATPRNERLGSFGDVSDMKTVQETILELARSRSVLRAALVEAGPPADCDDPAEFPTEKDVAGLRESLKITPPGGAEFGKTEVFYLQVKQNDRERAIVLADAICDQLETSFQTLRGTKYESVIAELERTEILAESNLEAATRQLAELETAAGVDLAELRMLHVSSSSTSDLRQKLVEVENELRDYEADMLRNEQLHELLVAAQDNPGRLLASPNSLLESQPGLRQLKEGLLAAQLKTADLEGSMSPDHPLVISAKTALQEISGQLHNELAIAREGVAVDLKLNAGRIAALKAQLSRDAARLEKLAAMRAEYSNRVAQSENRTTLLQAARSQLSEARAQQSAAGNVSLISRIDTPDTGTKPVGPGGTILTAAGLFGGLLIGLGLVFLTVEPPQHAPADLGPDAKTLLANLLADLGLTDELSLNDHRPRRPEPISSWS